MRYGPDDHLPRAALLVYSLQWLASATYPVIVALAVVGLRLNLAGQQLSTFVSASMLSFGLATLIQSLYGHRMPVISGPSILPALTMLAAVNGGAPLAQVFGALLLSGLVVAIFGLLGGAPILRRVLTPLATGTLLLLIGLSTATIGMGFAAQDGTLGLALGLGLGISIGWISVYAGGMTSTLGVLISVVAGYLLFSLLGRVNWGSVFTAPVWQSPTLVPLAWPQISVLIPLLVAQLANAATAVGNSVAAANLVQQPFSAAASRRTLLFNAGLETILTSLLGCTPNVPYAVSISVVTFTRVASRDPVALAGVLLMALSFFGPGAALLAAVPHPVAGAVLLGVAGPQIGMGARLWQAGTPHFSSRRLFMVSVAVFVAIGQAALPNEFLNSLPAVLSQIMRNSVVSGLILIILFEQLLFRRPDRAEVVSASTPASGHKSP